MSQHTDITNFLRSRAYIDKDLTSKVSIDDAVKGTTYYCLDGELTKVFGVKISSHFRIKTYYIAPTGSSRFKEGTTTCHTEMIETICDNKEVMVIGSDFGESILFKASSAKKEELYPGSNYRSDVMFYDENGDILCSIEVVVTHWCEDEKVAYIRKSGILTLELEYERHRQSPDDYNRSRTRIIEGEQNKNFRDISREIQSIEHGIKYDEFRIQKLRQNINCTKEEIKGVEGEIKYYPR